MQWCSEVGAGELGEGAQSCLYYRRLGDSDQRDPHSTRTAHTWPKA